MNDDIPIAVRQEIETRLTAIERDHDVTIFYCCESGSRAWGFASEDSDYDVRFLYVHRRDWYVSLWEGRDVIETPVDGIYDVNGWDLRKALRLADKGNPVLFEWLSSPICYVDRPPAGKFRDVVLGSFDPAKAFRHYLSMARDQARANLKGAAVRQKKYFYVLRPLAACFFLLENRVPVPMRFEDLMAAVLVPLDVQSEVAVLLAAKRRGLESTQIARLAVLDRWIEASISVLEAAIPPKPAKSNSTALDAFFGSVVVG